MNRTGFLLFVLCFALASCATVLNGPNQRVHLDSNPGRAAVYLNGKFIDSTPCTVVLHRHDQNTPRITVAKEGYGREDIFLKRKINETAFLNFVLPWNWLVDIGTGAVMEYRQHSVKVELRR